MPTVEIDVIGLERFELFLDQSPCIARSLRRALGHQVVTATRNLQVIVQHQTVTCFAFAVPVCAFDMIYSSVQRHGHHARTLFAHSSRNLVTRCIPTVLIAHTAQGDR